MNFIYNRCARLWKSVRKSSSVQILKFKAQSSMKRSILLNHPFVQVHRNFVFIHVPKTAGTSVRKALRIEAPLNTDAHSRAVDVIPHIKSAYPKVVSVSFVRNPFARFVSLYNFARVDESLYCSNRDPSHAPFGKHVDYDILSDKSLEECAELLVQGKLGGHAVWPTIWHRQVQWLTDDEGKIIVDFIGRVETLAADLQRLRELHGIESSPPLRLNESKARGEAPKLTPRACELIRLYYKRDFEMLGYDEAYPEGPAGHALQESLPATVLK